MNWTISTRYTVEETNSGFIIFLLGGSWVEPTDVKTQAPEGMSAVQQATYLRLGLDFAKDLMVKREKYRKPQIA